MPVKVCKIHYLIIFFCKSVRVVISRSFSSAWKIFN